MIPFLLILLLFHLGTLETSAEDMVTSDIFTAQLSSGVSLSQEGILSHTLYPLQDETAIETLTITFHENLEQPSSLLIAIPSGMSFVGEIVYSDSFIDRGFLPTHTYSIYDSDTSTEGIQQDTGTYINENAGQYFISLPALVSGDQIQIQINYDRQIWSHKSNSPITNSTALTVTHSYSDHSIRKFIEDIYVSASHVNGGFFFYFPPKTEGGTETVGLDQAATFPIALLAPYRGVNNMTFHVKQAIFTIQRPYTGSGSSRVYGDYVSGSAGELENDNVSVEVTETQLIITITDYVHEVGDRLGIQFTFPSSKFSSGQTISLNATASLIPYIGTSNIPTQGATGTLSVRVANENINLSLYALNQSRYTKAHQQGDGIELLGIMGFQNLGGSSALNSEIIYHFDTGTSAGTRNKLDVTNVNLPFPSDQADAVPSIAITFIDAYGEQAFTRSIENLSLASNSEKTGSYLALSKDFAHLTNYPILEGTYLEDVEYFIKKIQYTIPTIPALAILGSVDTNAVGGIYGYAIAPNGSTGNTTATSSLSINPSNTDTSLNSNYAFYIQAASSTWKIPILISSIETNKQTTDSIASVSNIVPGESISVFVELGLHDYPYTNSTNVPNPILYIIEPAGFSITELSTYFSVNDTKEPLSYTPNYVKTLSDGSKVYAIKLDTGYSLFSTKYLQTIPSSVSRLSPYRIPTIELTFVPDLQLENSFINLNDLFFVVDESIAANGFGSYDSYEHADEHDIDPTHSVLAKAKDSDIVNIVPNPSVLSLIASINEIGKTRTIVSNEGLETRDNYFDYLLEISNKSDTPILLENSIIYVPIPSDLSLEGAAYFANNSDFMHIYYSTTITENTLIDSTDWHANLADYSSVSMIKLERNPAYTNLPSLAQVTLVIPMVYGHEISQSEAGTSLSISAFEWKKSSSDTDFEDALMTRINSVTIEKHYVLRLHSSVTASNVEDSLSEIQLTLPSLTQEMNFYLSQVSTTNLDLYPPNIMVGSAPSVEEADRSFGLAISLSDSPFMSLTSFENEAIFIGNTLANNENTIDIKLSHYDNYFDETTHRSVVFTLSNQEGVHIYLTIEIHREVSTTTNASMGIIGGAYYSQIVTNSDLTLTQDSTFTAQYIYENPSWQTQFYLMSLSLDSANFPLGTKITLIHTPKNASHESLVDTPSYLYYEVEDTLGTIDIYDFKDMKYGTLITQSLPIPTGTSYHVFQVVVDFSEVDTAFLLPVSHYQLGLNLGSTDGILYVPFSISAHREINLTSQVMEATANLFTVESTIDLSNITGYDAKYLDHFAAIKISFVDSDGNYLSPPNGGFIVINGTSYPAAGEYYFINTLGSLTDMTVRYRLDFPMEALDVSLGELHVKTELYSSTQREHALTYPIASTTNAFVPTKTLNLAANLSLETSLLPVTDAISLPINLVYNRDAATHTMILQLYQKTISGVYEPVPTGAITHLSSAPFNYVLLGNGKIVKYSNDYARSSLVEDRFTLHLDPKLYQGEPLTFRLVLTSSNPDMDFEEIENFIILK